MTTAAETLDELVTSDLKTEWLIAKNQWFPRSDTAENAAYDKRTPGECNNDKYVTSNKLVNMQNYDVYRSCFKFMSDSLNTKIESVLDEILTPDTLMTI